MATKKINETVEDQSINNQGEQDDASTDIDFDIDAVLEEAAKDFADSENLLNDGLPTDRELQPASVEDEALKERLAASSTDSSASSENAYPSHNDSDPTIDSSLANLEKELAILVDEIEPDTKEAAKSDEGPASTEEPTSSSAHSKPDTAMGNNTVPQNNLPKEDAMDAAGQTTRNLETLERELSNLVDNIEPAQPSSDTDTTTAATSESVETTIDDPESNVDNTLNELEVELAMLTALTDEPADPVLEESELQVDVVTEAEINPDESHLAVETVSDVSTHELPADSPVVLPDIASEVKVPGDQHSDLQTVSSGEKVEDELDTEKISDDEITIPTEPSRDDKAVDDEFESVLNSYKNKHKLAGPDTSDGHPSPSTDDSKGLLNLTDIPLSVLNDTLTLLDKPFESVSKKTKGMIGALAVITSIMTVFATIVLCYL